MARTKFGAAKDCLSKKMSTIRRACNKRRSAAQCKRLRSKQALCGYTHGAASPKSWQNKARSLLKKGKKAAPKKKAGSKKKKTAKGKGKKGGKSHCANFKYITTAGYSDVEAVQQAKAESLLSNKIFDAISEDQSAEGNARFDDCVNILMNYMYDNQAFPTLCMAKGLVYHKLREAKGLLGEAMSDVEADAAEAEAESDEDVGALIPDQELPGQA